MCVEAFAEDLWRWIHLQLYYSTHTWESGLSQVWRVGGYSKMQLSLSMLVRHWNGDREALLQVQLSAYSRVNLAPLEEPLRRRATTDVESCGYQAEHLQIAHAQMWNVSMFTFTVVSKLRYIAVIFTLPPLQGPSVQCSWTENGWNEYCTYNLHYVKCHVMS